MSQPSLHRLAAFTTDPKGGNPAGVWVGEELPEAATMQAIAADLGYSETAFVAPSKGFRRTIRYFSPEIEVPFCGHATIATGVALGKEEGDGVYRLATPAGEVQVSVVTRDGQTKASLTSVEPRHEIASSDLVSEALRALRWQEADLDPAIPPARAYAGAWHLVLAVSTRVRLETLDYDFEALKDCMHRHDLTTLQLVWRESQEVFHSRNPFPIGGMVEDPATGAAAAALGGYLRDSGLLAAPARLLILQGEAVGRPSRLEVEIPPEGGIVVAGTAVPLDENDSQPGFP